MDNLFTCQDTTFTRLWHCFGNLQHRASMETAVGLLRESRSNVLPINTHRLMPETGLEGMEIGFAGLTLPFFEANYDTSGMVKMLNINHQTTTERAVGKTKLAFELTGVRHIKLEVLNTDMATSNDAALLDAVNELYAWNPELVVMPLLSNSVDAARAMLDAGCPMLRIMGSAIGSGSGLPDGETFRAICEFGAPVVLDGGIGSSAHAVRALELGATGVLVNSMLFESELTPVEVMRGFAADFFAALARLPEDVGAPV
jgi:thiazole synthase